MSILAIVEKDPVDRLDYDVDFSRWLLDGDIVVNAIADVGDTLVSFMVAEVNISPQVVKVWVSGGVDGDEGVINVDASTLGNRTKRASFKMRIKEC